MTNGVYRGEALRQPTCGTGAFVVLLAHFSDGVSAEAYSRWAKFLERGRIYSYCGVAVVVLSTGPGGRGAVQSDCRRGQCCCDSRPVARGGFLPKSPVMKAKGEEENE